MKLTRKKISFFCLFTVVAFHLSSIENSIVPMIDFYEEIVNLPFDQYSSRQFVEMAETLENADKKIRIVSYNILFNLFDSIKEERFRWPQRLEKVVELIKEMNPDILGIQELYLEQKNDLMSALGEEWDFYCKPTTSGELNGIFYLKKRFELIEGKVWYLTETPENQTSETLSMVHLLDRMTKNTFAVFNTHLSFSKVNKREYQARYIAKVIKEYAPQLPLILTGDFNTFPQRMDLKVPFYDGGYIEKILTGSYLKDSTDLAILGHLGPLSTFTNEPGDILPFKGTGTPGIFLDHIFVSPEIRVLIHAVQSGKVKGDFPSDHMPVIVDILI